MSDPTPPGGAARHLAQLSIDPYSVDERRCVIALSGDLDLASAPDLKAALEQLLNLGYREFALDLSAVGHMDSTGLGVLVGLHQRLDEQGRVALIAIPANVTRLLSVVGLDARLESFASVQAAFPRSSGPEQWSSVALESRQRGQHFPTSHNERASLASHESAGAIDADAGLVLGLASTALPFAESKLAEAERWLRILRRYGDAGRFLRNAEVREAPFADFATSKSGSPGELSTMSPESRLAAVGQQANHLAADRHAGAVGTMDVLKAVASIYGSDFDRVLSAYGGDHLTVREQLETT